jgi:hypothetical protein
MVRTTNRKSVAIMLDWLPNYHWILDQRWFFDHIPEWLIALFTFTLWWSTRKLWIATRDTLKHTQGTTEIIQRAYVSARLGGITTTTEGYVLAHVNFKNVGHLPAYDFKWHIDLTPSDQDEWKPPPVPDSDLRPSGVLPIGTTFKRGSKGIGVPSEKFIYAWETTVHQLLPPLQHRCEGHPGWWRLPHSQETCALS